MAVSHLSITGDFKGLRASVVTAHIDHTVNVFGETSRGSARLMGGSKSHQGNHLPHSGPPNPVCTGEALSPMPPFLAPSIPPSPSLSLPPKQPCPATQTV